MRTRTTSTLALASLFAVSAAACSSGGTTDSGNGQDAARDVAQQDTSTRDVTTTDAGEDVVEHTDVLPPTDAGNDSATGTDAGSDSGTSTPADHLLISEVAVQPGGAEFVEISNPTSAAVDLTNYYLSDNSSYFGIASGAAWNPPTSNPGTDFLVRFPSGASIPAGGTIVVATGTMFPTIYSRCPDFILAATPLTCASGGTAAAMVVPTNGDLGTSPGDMLSNSREMVILFQWTGNTSDRARDVDYVTWGDMFEAGTRVDKTGTTGYSADTAPAMQHGAPAPALNQSIERCNGEVGEAATGGNGITGHDETSERLDMAFRVQTVRTPGVRNSCP